MRGTRPPAPPRISQDPRAPRSERQSPRADAPRAARALAPAGGVLAGGAAPCEDVGAVGPPPSPSAGWAPPPAPRSPCAAAGRGGGAREAAAGQL
jgi:hypothetical protein